jgi:UDP-N-acetylglucosamine 1-carboxyvinyltransferase
VKRHLDKIIIQGGVPLRGTVSVRGAKNAALPILFATLLARGRSVIHKVPVLRDVHSTMLILRELGMSCERRKDGAIEIDTEDDTRFIAPWEQVRKMRASVCVLGPLLARRGKARVSIPGGCVFGVRPIDLHLKGLGALGANIRIDHGYVDARAEKLRGTTIYLGGPFGSTVLGTANVMMAACLAEGTTVIECAACEPEVADLANFLIACGAKVRGAGTPRVEIEGVKELHGAEYSVIPDRIEAGTFLIAGAMTGGEVIVEGANPEHLSAVIDVLQQMGVQVSSENHSMRVKADVPSSAVDVTTLPYPGFPTDLQAQIMAYLATAKGMSVITEKIYPDRFIHISELVRMGAKIRKEGPSAIISGVKRLSGAPVMASDLRASASLVLAGLVSSGITEVHRVYHLDRGYERIEERLSALGAMVRRESDED